MTASQLETNGSVVLDASGNGSVMLGPSVVRESWTLTLASVSASETSTEAVCTLYLGTGAVPGRRLTGTGVGSSGDTAGLANIVLQPGQTILAVWEHGVPGATATLNVVGTKDRFSK